jgi:2-methylisocitrate lyase-like PEP mutase family enzyme
MRTTRQKRADFRKLHENGCFVLPNPWDVGTARMFQHLGFSALASTSAGFAWSTGRPDYGLVRDEVLAHLRSLSAATDLPVNADFESGFGADIDELSESVGLAVEAGVSGLSVEDRDLEGRPNELYSVDRAVERVRAARSAIDRTGQDVILVARTETLLVDPSTISSAIDKLIAFANAGADCLYAPGVREKGEIASIVRAVAPKARQRRDDAAGPELGGTDRSRRPPRQYRRSDRTGRLGEHHVAHERHREWIVRRSRRWDARQGVQ